MKQYFIDMFELNRLAFLFKYWYVYLIFGVLYCVTEKRLNRVTGKLWYWVTKRYTKDNQSRSRDCF